VCQHLTEHKYRLNWWEVVHQWLYKAILLVIQSLFELLLSPFIHSHRYFMYINMGDCIISIQHHASLRAALIFFLSFFFFLKKYIVIELNAGRKKSRKFLTLESMYGEVCTFWMIDLWCNLLWCWLTRKWSLY
jgi:hypothetical protein